MKNFYAKRGKNFEKQVEFSLTKMTTKGFGYFVKSPTPIKIIKINYRYGYPQITNAVFEKTALCDFYGIVNKQFILIETKEVQGDYFNKNNLKSHQIHQLQQINFHGGISLILLYFKKSNTIIGLEINEFLKFNQTFNVKNLAPFIVKTDSYFIKIHHLIKKHQSS